MSTSTAIRPRQRKKPDMKITPEALRSAAVSRPDQCPLENILGIVGLTNDQARLRAPDYMAEVDALPAGGDVPSTPAELSWTARKIYRDSSGAYGALLRHSFAVS